MAKFKTFSVKVKLDNSAFDVDEGRPEITRMLREIIRQLDNESPTRRACIDGNGNTVGEWRFK